MEIKGRGNEGTNLDTTSDEISLDNLPRIIHKDFNNTRGDEQMATVYTKTATKALNGKVYAFGRRDELNGKPIDFGGYVVFVVKTNYCGKKRGGVDKSWVAVEQNMSYEDAMSLMNVKCGYKAFGK